MEYNEKHGITPSTVKKDIRELISISSSPETARYKGRRTEKAKAADNKKSLQELLNELRAEMKAAAKELRFEEAAYLRDKIRSLEQERADPGRR